MSGDAEEGHRLTEQILIEAVANELQVSCEDVLIKSFDVSGGSAKGDNYACTLKALEVTATVKGEEKKLSYMAKCVPMSQFRANFLTESGLFTTEVVVFKSILPRLRDLERGSELSAAFPKHFYASAEKGVIIMENMKLKGWYMADHAAGLTATQLRLVLIQLARLHAISFHYLGTFPGGLEQFKKEFGVFVQEGWLPKGNGSRNTLEESVEQSFNSFSKSFVSIVQEIWNGDQVVIDKLKAFNSVLFDRVNAVHKPVEDGKGINCLLHMDSWTNNFFFRNNADGDVSEAAIIDLQLMKRGRPCTDLTHLLGTSTSPELREEHLEDMLKLYYEEFSRVLLVHGYDMENMYPFSTFLNEFDECGVILFVMGAMGLRIHMNKPDPEDFFKGTTEEQQMKLERQNLEMVMSNDVLKKRFIDTVKEAIHYGVLDSA